MNPPKDSKCTLRKNDLPKAQRTKLVDLLNQLLADLDQTASAQFLTALLKHVDATTGSNLDADDVTAILIEATDSTVTLKNNLLAPVRVLKSLLSRPHCEPIP